eukprot:evm.model.scf_882.3 EVM.evm.TU.scf_882.3   scf_882:7681-9827(-)
MATVALHSPTHAFCPCSRNAPQCAVVREGARRHVEYPTTRPLLRCINTDGAAHDVATPPPWLAGVLVATAVALPLPCTASSQGQQMHAAYELPGQHLRTSAPVGLEVAFGGDGLGGEGDTIEPFTLYGTTFKKFLIEKLEGSRVVKRQRGFTVETCIGVVPESQETPQFRSLSSGEKVLESVNRDCSASENQELMPACAESCQKGCELAVAEYARSSIRERSLVIGSGDQRRVVRSCERQCKYECSKPGKAFDFQVPYRR